VPAVPYCWIALGSEGRLEQTFQTDQDNGLLFDAGAEEADDVRAALLRFAQSVNDKLDSCGFPRCAGGIMAGNSRWCLTLAEWRRTFAGWMEEPRPEALLHAAIFFDFRPVYGASSLAERLREWLLGTVAGRPVFLRMMAENALAWRPPLGAFRTFLYDRPREHPHTIDLKGHGSRIFSDAARILALARRVSHTSTAQRLRAVGEKGYFGVEGLAALVDGFNFVHLLRLRTQCRPGRPRGAANRIDPRELNELDRHVLRAALRQAGKLQEYLVQEYQLRT
jgi:CBS domain-containing protein